MVARSFFAVDSANMVVQSSSNGAIVGNPIVNNSDTPNGTVFTYSAGGGTTITLDDTGGGSNTFNDDQAGSHTILDGGGIVANGNGVEAESVMTIRALDSGGNPTGPNITLTVFSQNGQFFNVWGFATSEPLQDGVSYVKISGSNNGTSAYSSFITCFGPGTKILTAKGNQPVEALEIGDHVWTQNHRMQPIRWIGRTTVAAQGSFAPIVFDAGALDNDHELVVSPEHRMYMTGAMTELLFGQEAVLVAAKHLTDLPGVSIREGGTITYTHFMFDRHEVVYANGQLTESFFFSDLSLSALAPDQVRELQAIFPEQFETHDRDFGQAAAMVLKAKEASVLCHLYTKHVA
ncbi:MAG: Hint domain-containing protein [Pseudomonadota bacterium]